MSKNKNKGKNVQNNTEFSEEVANGGNKKTSQYSEKQKGNRE